jgi:hypothetical protein
MEFARSPENTLLDSELCSGAFRSQRKNGDTTFCSIKMLATPRRIRPPCVLQLGHN